MRSLTRNLLIRSRGRVCLSCSSKMAAFDGRAFKERLEVSHVKKSVRCINH